MSIHPATDSLFMKALRQEPVERTPVWIMRQAGRYLPEYRKVRAEAGNFLNLCKTPELACEVTMQPLRRFDLDAAILFSDILTIPDAMGLGLYFSEGEGPRFKTRLNSAAQIKALPSLDVSRDLAYVFDAVSLIRSRLDTSLPLIGFSGSPWTLACYMVEGGSSKAFDSILQMLFAEPELMHELLQKLCTAVSDYLIAQANAGADVLMIFDSWGGILPAQAYRHFSLFYMKQIMAAVKEQHPDCPVILFTKAGGQWIEEIASSGCDAIGLDWTSDLAYARQVIAGRAAIQGNLHPGILLTDPQTIRQEVRKTLASYGKGSGHLFNLGHGITPDVPPEHVQVLVSAVKEMSPEYHVF